MSACVLYQPQAEVSSMDTRKRKSESHKLSLSFGDIYTLAANQQKRAKNHGRRHTTDTTVGCRSPDLSPLPDIFSRVGTSESEPTLTTTGSAIQKRPPLTPMSCLRSESTLRDDYYSLVSSLCRQCCDVLGPKACHQCIKVHDRRELLRRSANIYNNLEATEENVTSANTLKKYLPDLTQSQIHDSIATGQIARNSVNDEIRHRRELSIIINESCTKTAGASQKPLRTRVVRQNEASTQAFFVNIKALNDKIVAGDVPKDLKSFKNLSVKARSGENADDGTATTKKISFTETVCPTFVSPRKQAKEKQVYSAYYAPPLLPLNRQNVEPMFFAGSDKAYVLPERLPDKVVDGQDEPDNNPTYMEMLSSPDVSRPTSKYSGKLPRVTFAGNGSKQMNNDEAK